MPPKPGLRDSGEKMTTNLAPSDVVLMVAKGRVFTLSAGKVVEAVPAWLSSGVGAEMPSTAKRAKDMYDDGRILDDLYVEKGWGMQVGRRKNL